MVYVLSWFYLLLFCPLIDPINTCFSAAPVVPSFLFLAQRFFTFIILPSVVSLFGIWSYVNGIFLTVSAKPLCINISFLQHLPKIKYFWRILLDFFVDFMFWNKSGVDLNWALIRDLLRIFIHFKKRYTLFYYSWKYFRNRFGSLRLTFSTSNVTHVIFYIDRVTEFVNKESAFRFTFYSNYKHYSICLFAALFCYPLSTIRFVVHRIILNIDSENENNFLCWQNNWTYYLLTNLI